MTSIKKSTVSGAEAENGQRTHPRPFSSAIMAGRFLRKICSHIALPLKHSSTILTPRTTSAFLPKNVCLRMAGTSSSKAKEKREM